MNVFLLEVYSWQEDDINNSKFNDEFKKSTIKIQ